jgi:hypothetical protein
MPQDTKSKIRKWEKYVKRTTSNSKLPKETVKAGHELGRRLEKHEDHIKTPYGLGMWMAKKGIRPKKKGKKKK